MSLPQVMKLLLRYSDVVENPPFNFESSPCDVDIGIQATYGLLRDFISEIEKTCFKVTYICGAAVCLPLFSYVLWRTRSKRKTVLSFEESPHCRTLFENFFYSACPWYRYKLEWIQKYPPMSFGTPLIVVSRSLSRLKDEVDATLENITYTDNIMLIVMHNCEPSMRPTKLLRRCEDKRVISFTNILTWNGSIYACPINETAKGDIRLYIKQNQQ